MSHILLLHAAVGMGHYRAATALAHAFKAAPGIEVQVEDTLDHASALFGKIYAGLYLGIADHIPAFWSRFYNQTDQPPTPLCIVAHTRKLSTTLGVRGLPRLLEAARPDAIICTHFLPLEVLGPLRQHGLVPPLYCVVTDYRAHHFWAVEGVDGYFVPTPATADQLVAAGICRSRIHILGIPIDPSILVPVDKQRVRHALGLPLTRPVVLLNGSGIVTERARAIALQLLAQPIEGTVVVAAGRNHELVAALADLGSTDNTEFHVLGQQPSLDPLIAASDLVVGKAGGLTVSEVLGRGVPLIIPTPVPGQEQANADYVVAAGAGLSCDTAKRVAEAVMTLLHEPQRRAAMAHAARQAGRPAAAQAIVARVLADLTSGSQAVRVRPPAETHVSQQYA